GPAERDRQRRRARRDRVVRVRPTTVTGTAGTTAAGSTATGPDRLLERRADDGAAGHVDRRLVGLPGAHVVDVPAAVPVERLELVSAGRALDHAVLEVAEAVGELLGIVRAVDHRTGEYRW